MELKLYEFSVNGEKWDDKEDYYLIESDNPRNALTKLRILHGESVYRRCYMVTERKDFEGHLVGDLYSYGMLKERGIRDYGRKYFYKVMQNRG